MRKTMRNYNFNSDISVHKKITLFLFLFLSEVHLQYLKTFKIFSEKRDLY